ncbi:hypothetical protein [Corynebacterium guangdongense]|uniref:DUF3846 domain-containing protein n=1 Tax=Corynebacterium guangdongense TaxID=1783348 RepID=A0ABU1ZUH3_9CORY|nr:hypothetical protein [Corynebacterium guangdongense]MDR7328583.1 hypothetical protein [Corynebacterium guangdongense]WJZ17160.1 hypothetical protein CGUA_02820 [Corynebacterium guangdongense]
MPNGLVVNPDGTQRLIDFELPNAREFIGGLISTHVDVSFNEAGRDFTLIYNPDARDDGAAPSPVGSLARMHGETGNSTFFLDPVRAVFGPVIFVGADGGPIGDKDVAEIHGAVEAARNYSQDYPDEYRLWNAAARNMGN